MKATRRAVLFGWIRRSDTRSMQPFKSAHSTADSWGCAAKECVAGLGVPPDDATTVEQLENEMAAAELVLVAEVEDAIEAIHGANPNPAP
jgi:hypothetical protein